ncbi:hypothetical protein ACVME8_003074 [Bradyrhizobium diazoefficiens]
MTDHLVRRQRRSCRAGFWAVSALRVPSVSKQAHPGRRGQFSSCRVLQTQKTRRAECRAGCVVSGRRNAKGPTRGPIVQSGANVENLVSHIRKKSRLARPRDADRVQNARCFLRRVNWQLDGPFHRSAADRAECRTAAPWSALHVNGYAGSRIPQERTHDLYPHRLAPVLWWWSPLAEAWSSCLILPNIKLCECAHPAERGDGIRPGGVTHLDNGGRVRTFTEQVSSCGEQRRA